MRVRAAYIVLLGVVLCCCSGTAHRSISSPPNTNADDLGQLIEPKLASILPQGWSLIRSAETFTLSRNEKVFLYNPVGLDVRNTIEQNAKKYGVEDNYVIKLRFQPLMTREAYERLELQRKPFEILINGGARDKDEWSKAIEEYYRYKVPVYFTDKYTVFAERSDAYPTKVYPEIVFPEGKQVVASLDTLFQRYEKNVGRNGDF